MTKGSGCILLVLAPMAGITDSPFRLICREFGCDWVVSEMVHAKGLVVGNRRSRQLISFHQEERPIAIQLFGSDPSVMADAAQLVAELVEPDGIDINMGCPTPKIVKNGDGAALLRNEKKAIDIARQMVKCVRVPVSVKLRLGWDSNSINCVQLAQSLCDVGVSGIALHARTREQFYGGVADWSWLARLRSVSTVPITGNGDVWTPALAKEMIDKTGCHRVMIGRAALGNPWIFHRTKVFLTREELPEEPDVEERVHVALRHLDGKVRLYGEKIGVRQMRAHLAWYLKGIPFSAQVRAAANKVTTQSHVAELVNQFVGEMS